MKRIILSFMVSVFFSLPSLSAADAIRVVATTPDLADIGRRIGGDRIEVTSLATGVEDPHSVPMKPSFAIQLNKAELLLLQGLDLEHAFLPGLLEASRNPKIQPGAPGYVDCSVYVAPLEVPAQLDRLLGEQHPRGNPHFNLDPEQGKKMARAVEEGLARAIPEGAAEFAAHRAEFDSELDAAIARWRMQAAPLRGVIWKCSCVSVCGSWIRFSIPASSSSAFCRERGELVTGPLGPHNSCMSSGLTRRTIST